MALHKKSMRLVAGALFAAPVAAALMTAPAAAKDYTYATQLSSEHLLPKQVLGPIFADLAKKTNGSLNLRILANSQLVGFKGMLAGVRDRLADTGGVVPSYHPSELPYTNVVYDLQMSGDSFVAISGATHEILATNPLIVKEWAKNKMVMIASYAIPSYVMMCAKKRIVDVADMKGLRVNATGGFSRFLVSIGVVPVNFSSGEAVQGLERGSIDCFAGSMAWVKTYSLADLTKYVTDYALMTPRAVAFMSVNRDMWQELSASDRKALWDSMPGAIAKSEFLYLSGEQNGRKLAASKGVEMVAPGKGWDEAKVAFLKSEATSISELAAKRGAKEAASVIADYNRILAEWSVLAKEIGNDEAKFADALRKRIYDKVDPNKL